MNHISKQNDSKKRVNIVMILAFVLLSNVAVFGQTVTEKNTNLNTTIESNLVEKEATSNTSNMNFVIWFMGSKQNPSTTILPAGENTRKQFITSGLAPNRLLIKAFLKKAVNFEVAAA
jgi:DNA polymerase sigma